MQSMDFEKARFNMVEQQVRPWDVLDQSVLDLLFVVKREDFVPPEYRALAFSDMEIPLRVDGVDTGEAMWSPKLEARILQELALKPHENVLEIGTGSGYFAALLAHKAQHVVSVEIDPRLQAFGARQPGAIRRAQRQARSRGRQPRLDRRGLPTMSIVVDGLVADRAGGHAQPTEDRRTAGGRGRRTTR